MSSKGHEIDSTQMKSNADIIEQQRMSEEALLGSGPRTLWQSYEELNSRDDQLVVRSREFSEKQKAPIDFETPSVTRRSFIQWMGAASALLGTVGCKRREVDQLVPYVHKPQGYVMGVPVWFATSSPDGFGLLVKTREGKPIKLEGNPEHPLNRGGLDAEAQASLMNLFNPERLKGPTVSGKSVDLASADDSVKGLLDAGGVRLLTAPILSPSLQGVIDRFVSRYKAKHYVLPSIASGRVMDAVQILTGTKNLPSYRFDKAEVVVSFDSDFLGADEWASVNTKQFSSRRKIHQGVKEFNQLFVFESSYTVTGVAADYRYALSPKQVEGVAAYVLSEVSKKVGASDIAALVSHLPFEKILSDAGLSKDALSSVVTALVGAKNRALVVSGGYQTKELHLMTLLLNQALRSFGTTVDVSGDRASGVSSAGSPEELLADVESGGVATLIISGVNPAYTHHSGWFEKIISKVKNVVVIAPEQSETTATASVVLGESHFLEAWGDCSPKRGVYSVQQPVIEPIYKTRSLAEYLSAWLGDPRNFRDVVKENSKRFVGALGDWNQLLKSGVAAKSSELSSSGLSSARGAALLRALKYQPSDGLELSVYATPHLREGRFSSNAWLQELPDPISKAVWSNYAAVSPELGKKLGLTLDLKLGDLENDVVEISSQGRSIRLPAHIQPGLKGSVVSIALGYGRKSSGSIATGAGKNVLDLISGDLFSGTSVQVKKTGETYPLATTQRHFELHGRDQDILQTATLDDFLKKSGQKDSSAHKSKHQSIYAENEFVYPGHKWGMAIDLNSCTGCQACVVACYSENNIGIVGEAETFKGRHLAWLRMDLYYSGDAQNPEANFEPMLCQQCSNAPCETVCPVLATVHSSDGLNDMVYNRCVGTRYCANNCPYKVRRFNYFGYTDSLGGKVDFKDPLPLLLNPDVTVRSRGVMEKCTFCVQRIRRVVDETKEQGHKLKDGDIKTACQQSCPADAIVFGDLNDPESQVSRLSAASSSFKVLEILNTRPSVTYLPRLRNKGIS